MRTRYFALLILIVASVSCDSGPTSTDVEPKTDADYILFGHFYGLCLGETCIETYKLTDSKLFEDTVDHYGGGGKEPYPGKYVLLADSLFQKVKGLKDHIPEELVAGGSKAFGMPDAGDGGGIYVERSENGIVQQWWIDNHRQSMPDYLYPFVQRIRESIDLLSEW